MKGQAGGVVHIRYKPPTPTKIFGSECKGIGVNLNYDDQECDGFVIKKEPGILPITPLWIMV
jgi:hypothetical protein